MQRKRINITFDEETYRTLKTLAAKDHVSIATLVRQYTEEGITGKVTQDNIDFISVILREQLVNILTPQVERLASLSAKTCIEATTATYLTAETIAKFVPGEDQEDMREVYEKARKKAIATIRVKTE